MKDETTGDVIEELVELKEKMHSYLIDNNSEYKKAISVNRNLVATISHNEYKDVGSKYFKYLLLALLYLLEKQETPPLIFFKEYVYVTI